MKRENNLIEKIADPDNLRLAFWKAGKAKDRKIEVADFRKSLDSNLLLLRNEMLSGNIRGGKYHYFTIYRATAFNFWLAKRIRELSINVVKYSFSPIFIH